MDGLQTKDEVRGRGRGRERLIRKRGERREKKEGRDDDGLMGWRGGEEGRIRKRRRSKHDRGMRWRGYH